MSEKRTSTVTNSWSKIPLRVCSLIALFIGSFTLAKSVFEFIQYFEAANLSMVVVVIYLLNAPLMFAGSLLAAYGVHKMCMEKNGDKYIVFGFAFMVLAAVANLIYVSIHHAGDMVTFYLLNGIILICFIICFLYFQGMGNRPMALCAAILLVCCFSLNMEEMIRYFVSGQSLENHSYYIADTSLNLLLGIESLLLVIFKQQDIIIKDK